MLRGNKNKLILIMCMCCLLVFIGVGYAALSTRLDITGEAKMAGEWDICITNMVATTTGIAKDVSHSFDKATATFKVNLFAPGDSVEYAITIENKGNITAALKQITSTVDKKHNDIFLSNTLVSGQVLEPGETLTFTVKSEFDISATTLSNQSIEPIYNIEIIYYQYEGNEIITPPDFETDNVCFTISNDGTLGEYDYSCGLDVSVPATVNGIKVTNISNNSFHNEKYIMSLGYSKVKEYTFFSDYYSSMYYYFVVENEDSLKKLMNSHGWSSYNKNAAVINAQYHYLLGETSDYYFYKSYWMSGFDADGTEDFDTPDYILHWYNDPVEFFVVENEEAYEAAAIYLAMYGYDTSELYVAGDPNIPYDYRMPLVEVLEEQNVQPATYYTNGDSTHYTPAAFIEELDLSSAIYLTNITTSSRFKSLTSLTLPDASLTTIGPWTFSVSKLTNVVIPSSVTNIGMSAFGSMQSGSIIKVKRRNSNGLTLGNNWSGKATVRYIG